jgi:glyoxylase-like metal-dependent hydrolase (beta-lactamase superfamily II)
MYGTVFAGGRKESKVPPSGAVSKPKTQAVSENVFTYTVGDYEVSLLVENRSQGNPSILIGADEEMLKKYLPNGTYATEVNTFLIRTPELNILVDTGFGATLFQNMQTLGVKPEEVDAVLLTHMHGDHIGGLQRDGKPLFPGAAVYLSEQEKAYWIDTDPATVPEQQQRSFISARAALEPYGESVVVFTPGTTGASSGELFPGITAIAAFGHTPGHTAYMVNSGGERLLIWGDLVHAMEIQIPVPDVSISFDTDPVMAAASRKAILEYVSANRIPVAGMHLVYPAIGTIAAVSEGSYQFTPAE